MLLLGKHAHSLKCDPRDTNLVLTEAPNCPQALQASCDQMIFEEFEFASYYRCQGSYIPFYRPENNIN